MRAKTSNPNECHPEWSTTVSDASRRAQSKDPYPARAVQSASRRSPGALATISCISRPPFRIPI